MDGPTNPTLSRIDAGDSRLFWGQCSLVYSPDAVLNRAVEEQQKGDFSDAIRDYQAVLAVRPATLAARVNLGAALAHTGQVDAAIEQYQAALKLAPQLGSIHLNLGLAYSRKGDLPNALEEFEAAHRASPQ